MKVRLKKITTPKLSILRAEPKRVVNCNSGRTKEEARLLRADAMKFLMFASLKEKGLEKLKEMGYDNYRDKHFIEKNGLSQNYMWDLQQRKDFKPLYYELVTAYMAKDLMPYIRTILKGRESSKGAQMIFPEEVGKALATRNINLNADTDDEGFRNEFFGHAKKKDKE